MRIQHNIPAMNAYRNFKANSSRLGKNLEKLSSGYKINRAGDDAAGLAISEKMRAQISGLEVAQKNAKDGISLVQTAEGALTEVHDMLNRMVTLAEQSANGTYSDDVDRVQLQKEVDELSAEIDRIADSANFNGIKLLDGSMDSTSILSTTSTTTGIGVGVAVVAVKGSNVLGLASVGSALGSDTILHKEAATNAYSGFTIDFNDYSLTDDAVLKVQVGNKAMYFHVSADDLDAVNGSGATRTLADVLASKGFYTTASAAQAASGTTSRTLDLGAVGSPFNFTLASAASGNLLTFVASAAGASTVAQNVQIAAEGKVSVTVNPVAASAATGSNTGVKVSFAFASGISKDVREKFVSASIASKIQALKNNPSATSSSASLGLSVGVTVQKGVATIANTQLKLVELQKKNGSEFVTVASFGALPDDTSYSLAPNSDYKLIYRAASGSRAYYFEKITTAIPGGTTENVTKGGAALAGPKYYCIAAPGYASADKVTLNLTSLKNTLDSLDHDTFASISVQYTNASGSTATIALASLSGASAVTVKTEENIKLSVYGKVNKSSTSVKIGDITVNLTGVKNNALNALKVNTVVTASTVASATTKLGTEVGTLTQSDSPLTSKLTLNLTRNVSDTGANPNAAYNTSTTVIEAGADHPGQILASTKFDVKDLKIQDGTMLSIGGENYVFAVGTDSAVGSVGSYAATDKYAAIRFKIVDMTQVDTAEVTASGALTGKAIDEAFTKLTAAAKDNAMFGVGYRTAATAGEGTMTLVENADYYDPNDASKVLLNKMDTIKQQFSLSRISFKADNQTLTTTTETNGNSLTLQIGDTSESFNQLSVDIRDMHAKAMKGYARDADGNVLRDAEGNQRAISDLSAAELRQYGYALNDAGTAAKYSSVGDIDITTQEGAAAAIDIIKDATNYVSDMRGTLGATQNRLDHTINNLAVMQENIQDAESTIRDTDIAEEMMAYTKNSIMNQAAQAMLAQANQLPQGVLQLLQ